MRWRGGKEKGKKHEYLMLFLTLTFADIYYIILSKIKYKGKLR